jgi:hypothetical protein
VAAAADSLVCRDIFATKLSAADELAPRGQALDPVEARFGRMQLGYESEYTFDEAGPLLRDYAPLDIPVARWRHEMSDAERLQWLRTRFTAAPEFATETGLQRIDAIEELPTSLIVDSTGNLELVMGPFDSYAAWERTVDAIVARYGAGSQQAMISKPRAAAFGSEREAGGLRPAHLESAIRAHLGYLNFSNLNDMFAKLASGHRRFLKDPSQLTAQAFDHPFLGPMTKIKRDRLEAALRQNASGQGYDADSKNFVRRSDASFKYTGGPSYRPDIAGPARFSWEIRNAHRNVAELKRIVLRELAVHRGSLESFSAFAEAPAFDSQRDFERLPERARALLSDLFPSKADPRFNYEADERLALETFRNFALPLARFEPVVDALTAGSRNFAQDAVALRQSVARAASVYVLSLETLAAEVASRRKTKAEAKALVMGWLGRFAVDSGLAAAFERREQNLASEPLATASGL